MPNNNIDKDMKSNEVTKLILESIRTGSREDWEERITKIVDAFGKEKWFAAQKDANGYRMDKFGNKGKYPAATITPYKK
jgi:hypothetical protein